MAKKDCSRHCCQNANLSIVITNRKSDLDCRYVAFLCPSVGSDGSVIPCVKGSKKIFQQYQEGKNYVVRVT